MFSIVATQFQDNIRISNELGILHSYLKDVMLLPNDLTDLLRMKWIYAVSALDKLMHETIQIGMVEAFKGNIAKTSKFGAFPISCSTYTRMQLLPTPNSPETPEHWFEQEVIQRHKLLSFQDPDKIADALSLIWNEEHKWQKIALNLGVEQKSLKQELKNIVNRRNQIVHEADINPATGQRFDIDAADATRVVEFVDNLGKAIINLL